MLTDAVLQAGYPSRITLRDLAARYHFLIVGTQSTYADVR
jgi:myosin heavy subunit